MDTAFPKIIPADAVLAAISPERAMHAVERALLAMAAGHIGAPRSIADALAEGTIHVKTCAGSGGDYAHLFVAKINSNFPANAARHGLPTIQGALLAFDTSCGKLLAIVDSASVTSLRTAATTAIALRHLARSASSTATIIGCGVQGEFHLRALEHVLAIEKVFLFDIDGAKAHALAQRAAPRVPFQIAAVSDLATAARESDVVITCTSSTMPFLEASHVRPGTVVAAVGADNESKAEIGESLLQSARIVTDQSAQCVKAGDLRRHAGGSQGNWMELTEVVATHIGRVRSDEVVVFDSTGLAVQDLAIVAELLRP